MKQLALILALGTTFGCGGDGGTSGTGGTGGSGGDGGNEDGCLDETSHLLISEVVAQPGDAEFIEIWNTSASSVELSDYYLSDHPSYYGIADGSPWNPSGTPGTDFLVQFPTGTTVGGTSVLTVELGEDFEGTYGDCPDATVRSGVVCSGDPVPQMIVPTNGGLGANVGALVGNSEMVILFCWAGEPTVYDVDYVVWDDSASIDTHVDKTSVTGYQADTAPADQNAAPEPGSFESIGRCVEAETGETSTGGNGQFGHDETSEDFSGTFFIFGVPSPGDVNLCI